jgi:uridine kinase
MSATVETYAELARRVLDRPGRLGRTRLVAVDGPSGAGKTAFADRLATALGELLGPAYDGVPPIVHTDDLLDGWADQLTFWPRLEQWVLDPLRSGKPGRYRRYSWVRREFTQNWITVEPAPVVILDGVSTARASVRPELSLSVFLAAPSLLRRERALARDGTAVAPYLDEWRRGEEAHFAADATADHVDVVADGAPTVPHEPGIEYVRLR